LILKNLICISNEGGERGRKRILKRGNRIIYKVNTNCRDFLYLMKALKYARKYKCDYLVDATSVKDHATTIPALLENADIEQLPVELITVSRNEKSSKYEGREQKVITALQLLTGETIYGFNNSFRIYPVKLLASLRREAFASPTFHIDILILASRAGFRIRNFSFTLFESNMKLALPGNFYFMKRFLEALIPIPAKRLCERNFQKEKFIEFLTHPIEFLKFLLKENSTPGALAAASAVGMFIGTLPILGLHTALIIYFSIKLRLNKVMSVNISHLCMPPFLPFACIELGYFLRHGHWLAVGNFQTLVKEFHLRIFDWILGSLILAPLNAIVFAAITYIIAFFFTRRVNCVKEKQT